MKSSLLAGIGLFALVACDTDTAAPRTADEDSPVSASASAAAPQACRIAESRCRAFVDGMSEFGPALRAPVATRNPIDDATVAIILGALVEDQQRANANCTPVSGQVRPIAQLTLKSGTSAVLVGDGGGMCALMQSQ